MTLVKLVSYHPPVTKLITHLSLSRDDVTARPQVDISSDC